MDIYKLRKQLGLTQGQLAENIGVSYQTIQNWEKGGNIPSARLKMLASYIAKANNKNKDLPLNSEKVYKQAETEDSANNIVAEPTGYYLPAVSASAGLQSKIENNELERIPVIIPGWDKDVIFINVYGDSMYPKYNSGEVIGVKPIDFEYLNYGSAYVVVLLNGDTHIKIVQPGADKDHLILVSVNEFYKPKEYHFQKLKSFYSIKGVIKKEMM